MSNFGEFIISLLKVFFSAFWLMLSGSIRGLIGLFNIPKYIEVFKLYSGEFNFWAWLLAILICIVLLAAIGAIGFGAYLLVRKYIRFRKTLVAQEELLNEVGRLNKEVVKLSNEKDKILAMKVSKLGIKPDEVSESSDDAVVDGEPRFFKLNQVDDEMQNYVAPDFDDTISLEEICERFRNFACSRMNLYYDIRIIRLFVAALASTRLVILQGISGTGKTSLPYAFGKFLENDAQIASVQPSWRDRTELYGYFNEFTKKYNEPETLKKMYEATYTNDIYFTILDEMNIARVEYYFAEMLSILEMPSRAEWIIDLVPTQWKNDPKHLMGGRFRLPENMWYVGTANNDDSTFAISDKVYDRAIPINIDSKGIKFDAPYTESLRLNYRHLEAMFETAKDVHRVSEENLDKINQLDDYVIEHFRLAFGNRIVKQLREFVPAFVGCGGTEIDGIDYVLANKIFRKFESLNLAFIRDEIDNLVDYLSTLFGEENMGESKAYLLRLKNTF